MRNFTPEDAIAAAAARSGIVLPSAAIAQIAAGLAALDGQLLTAEEHAQLGPGAPIVRVAPDGKVWVNPKLAKMRRKRRPRPLARRVRSPSIAPRDRNRAPRRRRAAGTKTAASRAGRNDDPDPEPPPLTAIPENSNAERGLGRHGRGAAMSGQVVRFPLRAVQAVLVLKERDGNGWLALCGSNGWLCGSLREARREARWLARNRGLPVRELIGGAP